MSKSKKLPVIEPIIRVVGSDKEHALQTLMSGDNPPELKSIGMVHVPGGNTWVSFVMTSKGSEVLHLEVGEPNMKLIVEDEARINCVSHVFAPKDFE